MKNLARNFVQKLSPAYEDDLKDKNALSTIPDGTTLLLKPRSQKYILSGEIYAIKNNGFLYMSVSDVINTLELAIDFDEETLSGSGWFLKENWEIDIDLANNRVTSRGKTYNVTPSNIYQEDGIVFVRGDSISEWFDFYFDYDVSQQYVDISSNHPLPAVAKNERRKRKSGLITSKNEARLPRMDQQEKLLDIDAINVNLRSRYSKDGETSQTRQQHRGTISGQGQFLNHDTYALATQDNEEGLTNVRLQLSKQSEDPKLLGPLKARFYEIGDVNGAQLPLSGDDQRALGVRINNNPLVNNDFDTTDIDGNSIPGWDVELYRNDVLIGSDIVGEDGQYNFENVALFAGDNDFELLFFGAQGEIQRETLSVPVTAELLQTQQDTYEVSVQLEDRDTYENNPVNDEDRNQPIITARYNKFIGNNLAFLGLRSRSVEGDRRTYATAGTTSIIGGALVDTNVGIDNEANMAAEINARRNVAKWNLSANANWGGDDYITNDSLDPSVLGFGVSALRTFKHSNYQSSSVNLRSNYQENASGQSILANQLGLSHRINNLSFSNVLRQEKLEGTNITTDERINNSFSARSRFGKAYIRGGVDYQIKPDAQARRYFANVNYRHDNNFGTDFTLDNFPEANLTRGRLNLNYRNKYFRTSPFIQHDSNQDTLAGVSLNFNLVDVPNQTLPDIRSERVIGRGFVDAFVYFDRNGNFSYDEGDEILPDVVVESLNSRKRATTDEAGYAVMRTLSTSAPTDIVIDENSLPDPFMIAGFEGASVFPIAGQTHHLVFPIHLAGEVDGTIFIRNEEGALKPYANSYASLLSLDNPNREPQEAQALFDGFYLFSKVPPGQYLLTPKASTVNSNYGNPMPRLIEIGYDGSIVAGADIILQKQSGFVRYMVTHVNAEEKLWEYTINFQLEVKKQAQSQLGKLLNALSFKNYASSILKNLQEIESSKPDIQVYLGSQQQLHDACTRMRARNIECAINVIVTPTKDKTASL